MYKRIAAVTLPIALVALVAIGMWGYQENQEKNSLLIKAENQYQSAFHNLNYRMDQLQDELGKALAINSRKQLSTCLTDVWRLAHLAQNDVGQLPLTLMPFNKTESFLADIGTFSHRVAVRDLDNEPLTKKEYDTLRTLYERSNKLQQELQKVQTKVIDDHLRWMDVELALASEDKQIDNTIIDGLRSVDKKAEEYSEVDWGPGVSDILARKKIDAKHVKGAPITAEKAKRIAADFLDLKNTKGIEITKSKNKDFPVYSATVTKPKNNDHLNLDVTVNGGHVVWMLNNRDVKERNLSLKEGQQRAEKYLKKRGYDSMQAIGYDDYGNEVAYTMVYQQDGVTVYPDLVTVKVAMDNGEVTAFEAAEYITNHERRQIPKPKLTEKEARTHVNPNVDIQDMSFSLIPVESGGEVLCYEVLGMLGKSQYRIFINAETGDEEKVEKIKNVDLQEVMAPVHIS